MFVTNEYSRLIAKDGDDVILLPTIPFKAFAGEYTVGSAARVTDQDSDAVYILESGDKITGIGKVIKPRKKKKVAKDET